MRESDVILTALGEEHESQRSTIDVAWHVPVSAWADHGPSRATFHQYTHGTLRAPGGRDERHFFSCAGCDLESRQIAATCNDGGIRDGALWHLCELADHSSRCRFRYSRRISYYGRRTQRKTLARNSETLVTAGFLSVSISILVATVLVLRGLRAKASQVGEGSGEQNT